MIKELIRSIVYGNKATSERYIHYLKSLGCMIGERCTIFSPTKTTIDITRPWLIEIGNDVQITEGVTILTHGYDWSVLKGVYGEVLGSSGGGQNRKQCLYRDEIYNTKGGEYRK